MKYRFSCKVRPYNGMVRMDLSVNGHKYGVIIASKVEGLLSGFKSAIKDFYQFKRYEGADYGAV